MTSVKESSSSGKPDVGPAGQREFLITALRAASARSRLSTNLFDTIGVSLRHRMISCNEAVAWLQEEGLLSHIEYRPGMATGAAS